MVVGSGSNVVLTGFMGTGKSTIGRSLAKRLGFEFIDTDAIIEDEHGSIPDIFATQGEDAFRAFEQQVAAELAQRHGLVIATGGRMLLDEQNADALGTTGTIFCLTAALDELLGRLLVDDQRAARPLLNTDNPAQRIQQLLDERADGYGQFTPIDTTQRTVEDIVNDITDRLTQSPLNQ